MIKEIKLSRDQLEGRNVVIEALRREKRRIQAVYLDAQAKRNVKVEDILTLSSQRGVAVKRVSRQELDKMSKTGVHNGVIAFADPLPTWTTKELIDDVFNRGEFPFLVLADEIQYEHNLGAILRSAMGAGVHGVIVPSKRGKGLTPVVQRVSMGGAEVVPLIRESLMSAIKHIKKAGIPLVAADMDGVSLWETNLKGSLALVLGGESKGVSPTLRSKCRKIVSVPLHHDLDSLNVSVTAGIVMFEKCRQEQKG